MKKLQRLYPQRRFALLAMAAFYLATRGVAALASTSGAGSINGTVADAVQAVSLGAMVTATNINTGTTHADTSNSSDLYTVRFPLAGHYKVSTTAPNFDKVEVNSIPLLIGQVLKINNQLNVRSL